MTSDHQIRVLAERLTEGCADSRERAIRLHDFVRDAIPFGVTPRFDDATPSETLGFGRGHCNPKARLLVALCRAVKIPARQHFVLIPLEILDGVLPWWGGAMARVSGSHSYVDLELDGKTQRIDSFILDRPLFAAAQKRLAAEDRQVGYGAHRDGTVDWDGTGDAFSQFASADMMLEDYGAVEEPEDHYETTSYRGRVGPIHISTWLSPLCGLIGPYSERLMNQTIRDLRKEGETLLEAGAA